MTNLTLTGNEVLQVLPITASGLPAATTGQTTTGAIAALAGAETPVVTGIVANVTSTQASGTPLTIGAFNNITTVGGSGYSVTIPAGVVGQTLTVSNQGANAAQIFGTSPATINGVATATGISIPVGAIFQFTMAVAGNWLQNVQTGGAFSGTFDGVLGGNTPAAASVTTLGATGAITGGSSSNIAINTNKFTVAASTGNTLVAGTLAVTGASTLTGAVNGITITASAGSTLTMQAGKTVATNGSITLTGTDSQTYTFPTTSATIARTDAANTFTGTQTVGALVATGITQAPVAGGSSTILTAVSAGKTTLLDTVGGTTITLPAATGTGNVYRFFTTATTTGGAHKILAVGSDYLIGNINGTTSTALTAFHGLVGATYQSLQMPFAGSQPSGGIAGDWFEFCDVAAAKWAVKGQFTSGTSPTTPFNTATS